jgi:hypothetical protein
LTLFCRKGTHGTQSSTNVQDSNMWTKIGCFQLLSFSMAQRALLGKLPKLLQTLALKLLVMTTHNTLKPTATE